MAMQIEVSWNTHLQSVQICLGQKCFQVTVPFLADEANLPELDKKLRWHGMTVTSAEAIDVWTRCRKVAQVPGETVTEANKIDPKLIERIARAMCMADGNDPDAMCIGRGIDRQRLRGLAVGVDYAPPEGCLQRVWTLYASVAEAAIIELEAAAMDGDRAHAGDGNTGAPWYPPHLFYVKAGKVEATADCTEARSVQPILADMNVGGIETTHDFRTADNCARCGVRREPVVDGLVSRDCPYTADTAPVFADPQMVSWSEQCDPTDWSAAAWHGAKVHHISGKSSTQVIVDDPNEADDVIRDSGLITDALAAQAAIDKEVSALEGYEARQAYYEKRGLVGIRNCKNDLGGNCPECNVADGEYHAAICRALRHYRQYEAARLRYSCIASHP